MRPDEPTMALRRPVMDVAGPIRSVDQMIVLAAPSCCGKTVFIDRLLAGEWASLARRLQIGELESWRFAHAHEVDGIRARNVPRLFVHYALPSLALASGELQGCADDPKLSIVGVAEEVIFLTLYAPPNVLVQRVRSRRRENIGMIVRNPAKFWREVRRLRKLERLYADAASVLHIYQKWFGYCAARRSKSAWLISVESESAWAPASDWPAIARRLAG